MSISRSAWVETAGLFLALAFAAQAQVSVELLIDQEQFLRDESLPVKVRIVNRSGQTLHFGPLAGYAVGILGGSVTSWTFEHNVHWAVYLNCSSDRSHGWTR